MSLMRWRSKARLPTQYAAHLIGCPGGMQAQIRASLEEKPEAGHEPFKALPQQGCDPKDVLARLHHKARPASCA